MLGLLVILSGLYDVVKVLLDQGADASATGNIRFRYWLGCQGERIVATFGLSRGGFGALDDVFPLFAVAVFGLESDANTQKIIEALLSSGAKVNQ